MHVYLKKLAIYLFQSFQADDSFELIKRKEKTGLTQSLFFVDCTLKFIFVNFRALFYKTFRRFM